MDSFNYFNYFTEIEEYFWKKRGAHLLVSPLDWAILETWQKAGIPIDVVLRGIDTAFASYERSKRSAGRPLKSLAYCVDAVLDAAEQATSAAVGSAPASAKAEPGGSISREELRQFFTRNENRMKRAETILQEQPQLVAQIERACQKLSEIAGALDSPAELDLEDIERQLTIYEDKLTGNLLSCADETTLLEIRRELDRQLAPYRRKMTAEQLQQLERQYTQKRLFEKFDLPRLSLFYLT